MATTTEYADNSEETCWSLARSSGTILAASLVLLVTTLLEASVAEGSPLEHLGTCASVVSFPEPLLSLRELESLISYTAILRRSR
jgi:hypothetical protein